MKPTKLYELTSIEKIEAPEGLPGDNWYRYIIELEKSKIEGLRSGTLKAVTKHAEEYTHELNERRLRGGSTYSPRKQK